MPAREVTDALAAEVRRRGLRLVSMAFALQGFALSAMLTHMVPMLGAIGFGTAAVVIGSLFGPAQVLSRLINMAFGKNLSPPALATLSAALIVTAADPVSMSLPRQDDVIAQTRAALAAVPGEPQKHAGRDQVGEREARNMPEY